MLSFVKFLSFCFIASFAFVLQRHIGQSPCPLKMHASKGSPFGRAPAIAGERVLCVQFSPLRRFRRHLSQRERLFVSTIITQIGRENNISAEIYVSRTVEDAGPYSFVNILMRRSLIRLIFYFQKISKNESFAYNLLKKIIFHDTIK